MKRALVAAVLILASSRAAAEPVNLHMRTPAECQTEGGSKVHLPPGYFEDEPTHDKLDAEVRRLQEQETRLKAENRSLKGSLATWEPGWIVLVSTIVVAGAVGVYLGNKF